MYRKISFCAGALLLVGTTLVASAPAAAETQQSHTSAASTTATTYDEFSLPDKTGMRLVVPVSTPSSSPKPTAKPTPRPTHSATPAPRPVTARPKPRPTPTPRHTYTPPPTTSPAAYARSVLSADEFSCFSSIVERESGWNVYATNPSSGAYGLMQALPGSKMASAGADWRTNGITQVRWGISYMDSVYGSPCAAWSFWQGHSWY